LGNEQSFAYAGFVIDIIGKKSIHKPVVLASKMRPIKCKKQWLVVF
jgi:hypothetical protein